MALPPITQSNISTSWSANFFTIILTTNEPCDTYYTLDGSSPINSLTRSLYIAPFSINQEGQFTVKFFSISHNTLLSNLVQTQIVKIDNTAPQTVITPAFQPDGNDGWYRSLTTITLSAIDTTSGVNVIKYAWDGAAFQTYTTAFPVPSGGIHYLQVYAIDNASNREKTQTQIFKFDNDPPTTAAVVPLDVSYVPVTVTFVASDSASGYNTTYYTIDGTTPTFSSKNAASVDFSDAGFYTIKYFSVDNAGNIESVKTATSFRIELDKEAIQVLISESFALNGNNGWYRSSPYINILTTKPNLVSTLQYKVAPKDHPSTATYTSTVQITGTIDLSAGSFIALNIDESTEPYVISVRGPDATKTLISDIISRINATINAIDANSNPIDIATETGPDGLSGTGYVTLTSPTAGTGSPTSKIEFVSPGTFDATPTIFGLSVDNYPYTYVETYLYQNYTIPFLLSGSNIWNVTAQVVTTTGESAQASKDYKLDEVAPTTLISVIPAPNPYGFYTSSPDITFIATDDVSGIERTVYQFDNGPIFVYHASDGPIHLPSDSKQILLRYFSIDVAGNNETYHEYTFDYDFIPPTTTLDISAVNLDSQNVLDIMFSSTQIVRYNSYTNQYDFSLTDAQRQSLSYFHGWTSNLNALLYSVSTPISFSADSVTDLITFIPLYTLSRGDAVQVSSSISLPAPLVSGTDYFVIPIADNQVKLAYTYADAQSDIPIDLTTNGSGLMILTPDVVVNEKPTIVVYDPINIHLLAIDDREYQISNESITTQDSTIRELTVVHGFLKQVISIYNQTTFSPLSCRYFSNDKIYTIEPFAQSDQIIVSYVYTKIRATYYTTDGSTPTTSSASGHIIHLTPSLTPYVLKWFSIDEAGNQESVQALPFTITVINRAPVVNVTVVQNLNTSLPYDPNGDNNWYKYDSGNPTLRPTIKITYSSPDVPVYNEDSTVASITGTGPYAVEFRVLKVAPTVFVPSLVPAVEHVTSVVRIKNTRTLEIYSLTSFDGGSGQENRIIAQANTLPLLTDVYEIDYTFASILDTTPPDGRTLIIGNPLSPDITVDLSAQSSPYYYLLPNGYSVEGIEQITVVVNDLRGAQTVVSGWTDSVSLIHSDLKLDSQAPVTTDNSTTGWVNTNVVVTLTSIDLVPPVIQSYEQSSGVYRIYYSTDGSYPNTLYITGSTGPVTLTTTGQYTVRYRAIDNAGNEEVVKNSNLIQIDKIAPVTNIVVVSPDGTNGWYKTSQPITLTAIDTDSGVYRTYYKWDNAISYSIYVSSILIPSEGVHTLRYYSVDNVGNIEVIKSEQFKLDTVAPVSTDIITTNWTNIPSITINVIDVSSGYYRTYYTIASSPGPLPPDPTIASPYTETGFIPIASSGEYFVKYFSVDMAGNVESVKTAVNIFKLDLTTPIVVSIDPADLIFTTQTNLTINFTDTYSGLDISTVKVVVDDIEYSTTKNSFYFSYSGTPFATQVLVGPVASIPNFDNTETLVIYASDFAGNSIKPVVVKVQDTDTSPPYIRQFWPRNGADDVSRNTNVMFFIDDDVSGVDIRTVIVDISNVKYQLKTTDVIKVQYDGLSLQVFMNIFENRLSITVDGIIICNINLTRDEYNTIKKVADFISSLNDFANTIVISKDYDQYSSLDLINLYHIQIDNVLNLPVATFKDNVNINYMPRSRGYLIAVSPNEVFEDGSVVNVTVTASDFSGKLMTAEQFSFTCKEDTTEPRDLREKWYQTHVNIVNRIKSNLESTYNKRTDSTVFHGYFRALALEIARAQQLTQDNRDDVYYDGGTTQPALLYQNLGYLLKTAPRPEYTHEEYRQVLLSIMQMLFNGSTKKSILDGMAIFFEIYGVSSSQNTITEYTDLVRQFTFAFDIHIGSQPLRNWSSFDEVVNQVLSLVKPAHTYFLIRYLFSDIIRTQNIIDQITQFDAAFAGTESVRTDCADKYKKAEIITEDVSSQFLGTNNCCTAFYKPILDWAETTITYNVADIQATASGGPISVISVDGISGLICFNRNPAPTETVQIIYKFNKFVIYRKLGFYLNTYSVSGGNFDPLNPYLLNQINAPIVLISYDIPEETHAHVCESSILIESQWSVLDEPWPKIPNETVLSDLVSTKTEDVDLSIEENLNVSPTFILSEAIDPVVESEFTSDVDFDLTDLTLALPNIAPFTTNTANSITNSNRYRHGDRLFWIVNQPDYDQFLSVSNFTESVNEIIESGLQMIEGPFLMNSPHSTLNTITSTLFEG